MTSIVGSFPPNEISAFYDLASTIGGYVVFPANKIDGKPTINGARGMSALLRDRFDLALECIRRWYDSSDSPLSEVLDRYSEFLMLFGDFTEYVDFFLLRDLIDENGKVAYWLPFSDFGKREPLPANVDEYQKYMENASAFTNARNARINNLT
ncbi:MAG: hypothetical protein LBO70_03045 [Clostridiales Family XIII bacterium]|nr:hypothetical protein [Clostridiales Family XIII bacterium]